MLVASKFVGRFFMARRNKKGRGMMTPAENGVEFFRADLFGRDENDGTGAGLSSLWKRVLGADGGGGGSVRLGD